MRELFTPQEEVDEIERVIADIRLHKIPSQRGVNALKSIAAGLRTKLPGAPGKSLAKLERSISDALKTKRPDLGYEPGSLRFIAQTVIGEWPAVRRALEKYDDETV